MRQLPPRRDHGFTLVELTVVLAVMVMMVSVLTAALVVFVRSDDSVIDRLTDTHDLQNLTNYLPGDVASAEEIYGGHPTVITDPFVEGTACYTAAEAAGTPVLQLSWSQRWRDGTQAEFEVVYGLAASDTELVRYACDDAGQRSSVLSDRFDSIAVGFPTYVPVPTGPTVEGNVKIELGFGTPDNFRRITASSRNYNP